jgi:ribosomal protein S14
MSAPASIAKKRASTTRQCDRCGIERVVRKKEASSNLCRDCCSALSKSARRLWRTAA